MSTGLLVKLQTCTARGYAAGTPVAGTPLAGGPRGGAPLGCTANMDCTLGLFFPALSSLMRRLTALLVLASHLTRKATSRTPFLARAAAARTYRSSGVNLPAGYLSRVASRATCSSGVQSVV